MYFWRFVRRFRARPFLTTATISPFLFFVRQSCLLIYPIGVVRELGCHVRRDGGFDLLGVLFGGVVGMLGPEIRQKGTSFVQALGSCCVAWRGYVRDPLLFMALLLYSKVEDGEQRREKRENGRRGEGDFEFRGDCIMFPFFPDKGVAIFFFFPFFFTRIRKILTTHSLLSVTANYLRRLPGVPTMGVGILVYLEFGEERETEES